MYTTSGVGGNVSGLPSPRGELVRRDSGLGILVCGAQKPGFVL